MEVDDQQLLEQDDSVVLMIPTNRAIESNTIDQQEEQEPIASNIPNLSQEAASELLNMLLPGGFRKEKDGPVSELQEELLEQLQKVNQVHPESTENQQILEIEELMEELPVPSVGQSA